MKNRNEHITVENLPLLEIVSKYTISGDKILFKRPDVDLLKHYYFENNIVFERIEGFRFKGQDLYPEIGLIYNNSNPEKSISSYYKDVDQFLGYNTNDIYFECKLVKHTIDDPFECIYLDELPLHEIVSMYTVRSVNTILLNLYNMRLLVDYCHKNKFFIISIENFSFEGKGRRPRDIYVGPNFSEEESKEDHDINNHIEYINEYLDDTTKIDKRFGDTEVPDVYFEVYISKLKETTLLK